MGVHPLWVLFATLAATAFYGLVGTVFVVPVVAIIAAALRYLYGMLLFERWQKAPVMEAVAEGDPKVAVSGGEPAGLRSSAGGEG